MLTPTMAESHGKLVQRQQQPEAEEAFQLRSFPQALSWGGYTLYNYAGFWLRESVLFSISDFHRHFRAYDSDLIIATMPKSGTTWLKALVFAVLNRRNHPLSEHPLIAANPHHLIRFFDQIPELGALPPPRIFATHSPFQLLPPSARGSRIVYLCRNPRDTFISAWRFFDKLRPESFPLVPLEKAFEQFCDGVCPFGPFWDHVVGYWQESRENPERVLFLQYEELKKDIVFQIRKLADFLGCPFSLGEEEEGAAEEIGRLCSFDNLKNLEANKVGVSPRGIENRFYFREGKVGEWAKLLTVDMVERLDCIIKEKVETHGLVFCYDLEK